MAAQFPVWDPVPLPASFLVSEHSSNQKEWLTPPSRPPAETVPPSNTPKLLWPCVSAAGPARYPPPGQRVQGPVQSCPPLRSQQGWPARTQSRCSGKIGQMANRRDRRWGDAWEPERTVHSRVCHLVPTSSGREGCFVQKLSRVLTLKCPNFDNLAHFRWPLAEMPFRLHLCGRNRLSVQRN